MKRLLLAFAAVACATQQQPPPTPMNSGSSGAPTAASGSQMGSGGSQMASGQSQMTFHATLRPDEEVPKPQLDPGVSPSGSATFTVMGNTITWQAQVTGLSSPYTAAHIHAGAAGVAGPVIVMLEMNPGAPGTASGQGTIDASSIKGKNPDGSPMTMEGLVAALQQGNTYVNVHTQNNKKGEARGQITQ
ncbi:MAG TPA: CHRD domain-containing protein [Myxococcales bacterium]|jgi:hypothetical protein